MRRAVSGSPTHSLRSISAGKAANACSISLADAAAHASAAKGRDHIARETWRENRRAALTRPRFGAWRGNAAECVAPSVSTNQSGAMAGALWRRRPPCDRLDISVPAGVAGRSGSRTGAALATRGDDAAESPATRRTDGRRSASRRADSTAPCVATFGWQARPDGSRRMHIAPHMRRGHPTPAGGRAAGVHVGGSSACGLGARWRGVR